MTEKIFTVTEVIEKLQDELDTQEETFVQTPEYIAYINEALDEAEAEIMNIYEGYFKTETTFDLVSGTKTYNLQTVASDLYANKILTLVFDDGNTKVYRIPRMRNLHKAFADQITSPSDEVAGFDVQNPGTATGAQLVLFPTPTRSVTDGLRLWYIRNAETVTALSDKIDMPEFINFIYAFVKVKYAIKEVSPLLGEYKAELEQQRELMTRTLSSMIPDEDQNLEGDLTFYNDFDTGGFEGGFN